MIPSNITHIGRNAFSNCYSLEKVEFAPDIELQVLEKHSFDSPIKSLSIPPSVSEFKEMCFPINLKEMIIMSGNKNYKNYEDKLILGKSDKKSDEFDVVVFAQRGIKSVTLPSNIKKIGPYAFALSSIESITISSSVTHICGGAFMNCRDLKHVDIPSDSQLQIIDDSAFSSSSIESICIPSSVTQICSFAFCNSILKHINFLPDSQLQMIGLCAFGGTQLERILIPSHVKEIDIESFSRIPTLKSCEFQSDSELRIIGRESFMYCDSLERFSFPSSVIYIGAYAFGHCTFQEMLIHSDSKLRVIEPDAFSCASIQSLFIPQHVTRISENIFSSSSIEAIEIPSNVSELKEGWCSKAELLKKVTVNPNNKYFKNYEKFVFGKSNKESDEFDVLVFVSRDIQDVIIPSNIKIIGSYAFSACQIKAISIPSQVIRIEKGAFSDCEKLENVEFSPDSELETIESEVFSGTAIKKILIPPHVKRICEHSFSYCSSIQTLEFPPESELETIENDAFLDSSIEAIEIPSNVSELKEGWCSKAELLKKVTVNPNNKYFKNYEKFVFGKSNKESDEFDVLVFVSRDIQDVIIPSNIKIIGSYAFSTCQIKAISIPSQVIRIEKGAFGSCYDLQYVDISHDSELRSFGEDAFGETFIESLNIPRHVTCLSDKELSNCFSLNIIEIDDNSELEIVENLQSKEFMVPRHLIDFFD